MPTLHVFVDDNKAFECPTCGILAQQHRYSCFVAKHASLPSNKEP